MTYTKSDQNSSDIVCHSLKVVGGNIDSEEFMEVRTKIAQTKATAETATGEINKVRTSADAAQSTADTAIVKAHDAQVTADNAQAAATKALIKLILSTISISRARTGQLSPSSITASATLNNEAVNVRFTFDTSTDGSTWDNVYTSTADESSHTYSGIPSSVVKSGVSYYLSYIRVRIFAAGGTTEQYGESFCAISQDATNTPIWWGCLASAPADNVQIKDFYFDTTTTKLLYWTGSTWADYTSAVTGYNDAMGTAVKDITEWASQTGTTVTAAQAFISSIVANSAFIAKLASRVQYSAALCNDGTTPRMNIEWDNAILTARSADQSQQIKLFDSILRSIEGNYVLDHVGQSLIFRLASTLAEVARIKYDPTTGLIQAGLPGSSPSSGLSVPVKFVGSWVMGTWGAYSVVESVNSSNPSLAVLPDGRLICIYKDQSTGYLRQKIRATDGTWGAYSVVESESVNSHYPSLAVLPDGRLICVYRDQSTGYLRQKIRATDGTWGAYSVVESVNSSNPSLAVLPDGRLICVYIDQCTGCLRQKIRATDGTWGAYSVVESKSVDSYYPSLAVLPDGRLICICRDQSTGYLRQKIRATDGTWGAYSVVESESVNSYYPSLAVLPDGRVICVYQDFNTGYLRQKIRATDGTWGAYSVVESVDSSNPSLAVLPDGRLICIYRDQSTGYLRQKLDSSAYSVIPQKTAFAPVGAGICEFGQNSNGYYFKIKTGTGTGILVCLGTSGNVASTIYTNGPVIYYGTGTVTFPSEFYSAPWFFTWTESGISSYITWTGGNISTTKSGTFSRYAVVNGDTGPCGWLAIGFYTE